MAQPLTVNERIVLCSEISTKVKAWYDMELSIISDIVENEDLHNTTIVQYCSQPVTSLPIKIRKDFEQMTSCSRLGLVYEHVKLISPLEFLKELRTKQLLDLSGNKHRQMSRLLTAHPVHLLNVFVIQIHAQHITDIANGKRN